MTSETNESNGADQPVPGGVLFEGDTRFREAIVQALKTVYDPEIPVDIYELGLVYKVLVDETKRAHVEMTLTSPACPSAEAIPVEVHDKVAGIQGIENVNVEVVWDPPWSQDFMSDAAKVTLGMY
jgi:FeS assembly SUF system protein